MLQHESLYAPDAPLPVWGVDGMAAVAGGEPVGYVPALGLDAAAEQAAVSAYLPMVRQVVRQLASQAQAIMDAQDMVQIGLMGLLEALRRYGVPDASFVPYARQRVRGAILDELRRQDWRPRTVRQSAHKIRDAVRILRRKLGQEPTPEIIQKALGISEADYLAWEQAESAEAMASLDELVGAGMDMASSADDPATTVLRRRALAQALAALNEREQQVIQLYYEFDLNLKEIAAVLELSEARVCQLNKEALRKMRVAMEGA